MKTISTLCATSTVGIAACGLALGRPHDDNSQARRRQLHHPQQGLSAAACSSAGSVSTGGLTASSALSVGPPSTAASTSTNASKKAWYRRLSGSLSSAAAFSSSSSIDSSSSGGRAAAARHRSLTVTPHGSAHALAHATDATDAGPRSTSPLPPRSRNRLIKRPYARAASPVPPQPQEPSPSIPPGPPLTTTAANTNTTDTTAAAVAATGPAGPSPRTSISINSSTTGTTRALPRQPSPLSPFRRTFATAGSSAAASTLSPNLHLTPPPQHEEQQHLKHKHREGKGSSSPPLSAAPPPPPHPHIDIHFDLRVYDPKPVASWRVFFTPKRLRSKPASIRRIYPDCLHQPTLVLAHVISDVQSDTSSVYSGQSIYFDSAMSPLFAASPPDHPTSPTKGVRIRSRSFSLTGIFNSSSRPTSGPDSDRRHSSAPTDQCFTPASVYHTPLENFITSPLPRPFPSDFHTLPSIPSISTLNITVNPEPSLVPEPFLCPLPPSPALEPPPSTLKKEEEESIRAKEKGQEVELDKEKEKEVEEVVAAVATLALKEEGLEVRAAEEPQLQVQQKQEQPQQQQQQQQQNQQQQQQEHQQQSEGDNILQNDSIYSPHRLSLLTNAGSERASTLIGSDAGEGDFDIGNDNVFDSVRTRVNEGVTPVRVENIFDLSTSSPKPLMLKKIRQSPYVDDIDNISPTSDVFPRSLSPPLGSQKTNSTLDWLASGPNDNQSDDDDLAWDSEFDLPSTRDTLSSKPLRLDDAADFKRPEGNSPFISNTSQDDSIEWNNDGDANTSSLFSSSPASSKPPTWRPKTSYAKGKLATTVGPREGAAISASHSRSHSLPVRSAKHTSENWDDDFEDDGLGPGSGEVIVPPSIQARQQKLLHNLDSVKEFAALVEETGARKIDNSIWDEAEAVIALASTDHDSTEDEPPRGRQLDSNHTASAFDDEFWDEEDSKSVYKEEKRAIPIPAKSKRPSILPDENVFGPPTDSVFTDPALSLNRPLGDRLYPRHAKSYSVSSTDSKPSLARQDPIRTMIERMQRNASSSSSLASSASDNSLFPTTPTTPTKTAKLQFDTKMLGPLLEEVRKLLILLESSVKSKGKSTAAAQHL
ncbi:hypothetical protein DFH27DRAFT_521753 [Peziza echinospora]|nr:hypothetical protein DFH27DRAFT_521753 [Peziza echinospora]